MSTLDTISLLASLASLVLAVGAIWLSLVFFRMSTTASNATTEAAKGIAASVERLEKLFDKLYSDTFSMMRDTVSDMRKHIWPADGGEPDKPIEEVERKADEKIAELKKAMEAQVSEVLQRQRIAGDQVSAVRKEMRELLDRAIIGSRQVETEAREETMREHLLRELRLLRRRRPSTSVDDLMNRMMPMFPPHRVLMELERLRSEGLVTLSSEQVGPNTEVRLMQSVDSRKDAG